MGLPVERHGAAALGGAISAVATRHAITALIGLVHGYGFASMLSGLFGGLSETVQFGVAVVGFNVGVELGQLMIVAAVLVLVRLITAIGNVYSDGLRKSVAAASIVVASVWLVERIDLIASG